MQSHGTSARYAGRYAVVVLAMCALYPFLPDFLRAILFALSSASTLLPIAVRIRRDRDQGRLPWVLLFIAMTDLTAANVGGGRQLFGRPVDGLVVVFGTLAVAPLVMLRIHRLGRQREQAERALRHQATHDPLTGLANRGELHHRLAAALERERAYGRLGVVLLFCDLNGFKPVNDRLGHAVGDQVLVEVGRRLGAGLRVGDTLARYGGDEFLLLCEDAGPADAVDRLRDHVRGALATPIRLAGEEIEIGASVGAARSDGLADADELIRRADEAMYAEKHTRPFATTSGSSGLPPTFCHYFPEVVASVSDMVGV